MSTLKKTISRNAIDEIENELKQIDSIVNSWSSGRSLRFDPAHVRPRQVEPAPAVEARPNGLRNCFKISFVLNLIAFCFAIGYTASQAITGLVPAVTSAWILTASMIFMFSLNLVLVIWGNAASRKLIQSNYRLKRDQKRKSERTSLR